MSSSFFVPFFCSFFCTFTIQHQYGQPDLSDQSDSPHSSFFANKSKQTLKNALEINKLHNKVEKIRYF